MKPNLRKPAWLFATLLAACGGGGNSSSVSTATSEQTGLTVDSELADNVQSIPTAVVDSVSDDGNTIVLSKSSGLQPGSVLLVNNSAYKVTALVAQPDGSVTLTVTQPTLGEVFKRLKISGEIELGQEDLVVGDNPNLPQMSVKRAIGPIAKAATVIVDPKTVTDTDGTKGWGAKFGYSDKYNDNSTFSIDGSLEVYRVTVKVNFDCGATCSSGTPTNEAEYGIRLIVPSLNTSLVKKSVDIPPIETTLLSFYRSIPQLAFLIGIYVPVTLRTEIGGSFSITASWKGRLQLLPSLAGSNPSVKGSTVDLAKLSDPGSLSSEVDGTASLGTYLVARPRVLAAGFALTGVELKAGTNAKLESTSGTVSRCLTASADKVATAEFRAKRLIADDLVFNIDVLDVLGQDKELFPPIDLTPNCNGGSQAPQIVIASATCTKIPSTTTPPSLTYEIEMSGTANGPVSAQIGAGSSKIGNEVTNPFTGTLACSSWSHGDSTFMYNDPKICQRKDGEPATTNWTTGKFYRGGETIDQITLFANIVPQPEISTTIPCSQ